MDTQQTFLNCSIGVPKEEDFGPDSFEQYQAQKGNVHVFLRDTFVVPAWQVTQLLIL